MSDYANCDEVFEIDKDAEIKRLIVYYELHKFNKKTIEQLQARVEALEGVRDAAEKLWYWCQADNLYVESTARLGKALAATEQDDWRSRMTEQLLYENQNLQDEIERLTAGRDIQKDNAERWEKLALQYKRELERLQTENKLLNDVYGAAKKIEPLLRGDPLIDGPVQWQEDIDLRKAIEAVQEKGDV